MGEVLTQCEYCGADYKVKESRSDQTRFCSAECRHNWLSENSVGDKNPNWRGGKMELTCEQCGKSFKVKPANKEKSRFCSKSCYSEWLSENRRGERVEKKCEWCGDTFKVVPAKTDQKFCSRKCFFEYMSEIMRNEKRVGKDFYNSPKWKRVREDIVERDNYECHICGKHKEEVSTLQVHHIIPLDRDDPYNDPHAYDPTNLITLCASCHRKVHNGSKDRYKEVR